ncbi:MAG TPA: hypothetical protein VKT83_06030 [bacterium]|nr:hypothetical protein [bacterium]
MPEDKHSGEANLSRSTSFRREFLQKLGISAAAIAASQSLAADPAQAELEAGFNEMVNKMGDHFDPFPPEGIDGFLSHFIIMIEFLTGSMAGKMVTLDMPTAVQTVSRSAPFVYKGRSANHSVKIPIPAGSTLPSRIAETDFLNRPEEFFQTGRETVWMQILNLDARMQDPSIGPIRIILGETLKEKYPDIFLPSYGIAQSLGDSRFPARLYFNPYAIIETSFGAFRAIHGTLSYGRVVGFPPVGTPVSIAQCIPLESVDEVRKSRNLKEASKNPVARIIALAHPIDVGMQLPGDEAFRTVGRLIQTAE